ncbi:30S ribosomal protein S20 [soil metagenome]
MLRHKSAQKRARQTIKKTEKNKKNRALLKGAIKRTATAQDQSVGIDELKKTVSILDRAAAKGLIHKNKAANTKSKLAKLVNKIGK